jgi:tryptophan 2,3-dioxygenase
MNEDQPSFGVCPAGETPYSAYLQTEVLHSLQKLTSDSPAERAFMVNAQIGELYWALVVHELQAAQLELRRDSVPAANRILARTVTHLQAMNANWKSLSSLTPAELMPILRGIASTYGKDSSLQGWAFRHMAFLFGIKQRQALEYFKPQPHRLRQLSDALVAPSIYDDVLAALKRSGASIPQELLDRDLAEPYVPSAEVVAVWQVIYSEDDPADPWRTMAELLADIAVEFTNWKYLHLMATRRTFGGRPTHYAEDAIAWLLPTMGEIPFPEVWSARATVG